MISEFKYIDHKCMHVYGWFWYIEAVIVVKSYVTVVENKNKFVINPKWVYNIEMICLKKMKQ